MKRKLDGLMLFRAACGAWLIAAAWLLGHGLDADGVSGTLAGLAVMIVACFAERFPVLRLLQAAIGIWVMFSAALLDPADLQIYSDLLTGKALVISAAVSRQMFG